MHILNRFPLNRTGRRIAFACTAVAASFGAFVGGVQAQSARPFLSLADGSMSARIDGASCGEQVRMTFVGKEAEVFRNGNETPSRLMNNVTTLLRQQCPALVRVSSRGVVKDRIVYSGIAEAATKWEVVELGGGTGNALLGNAAAASASNGGPTAMELFGRDRAFVPAPKILEWLKIAPNLCVRFDPKAGDCAGLNQFLPAADNTIGMTASYRLDASGSIAELSYPARNKQGFFCTRPADAIVAVKSGNLSAGGRAEMRVLLLERIQAAGAEVCTGYSGTSPQALDTESFGAEGASQAQRSAAVLMAQRPPLRLDK